MAIRVNYSDVLEIMDSDCDVANSKITVMITAASAVIDKVFEGDGVMTDTMLKEVERWLTAHMIASTLYRTVKEEKVDDATVIYTGQWGKFLESTPYGQMVLVLDVTGKLALFSGKAGARIYAVKSFNS